MNWMTAYNHNYLYSYSTWGERQTFTRKAGWFKCGWVMWALLVLAAPSCSDVYEFAVFPAMRSFEFCTARVVTSWNSGSPTQSTVFPMLPQWVYHSKNVSPDNQVCVSVQLILEDAPLCIVCASILHTLHVINVHLQFQFQNWDDLKIRTLKGV